MLPEISEKRKIHHIVLFLLWPFFSMVVTLKNWDKKWLRNIFWLFCIYYGYTFVVSTPEIDAYRYIELFKDLSRNTYTLREFIIYLFSGDTRYVDILNPLVSFILSRFTSDGRILLAGYGMIFGFFYSRNLWYLLDRVSFSNSYLTILFVLVFALLDPIWKLGAFRFNTAIHIYLYGLLPFLIEGKTKRLWVSVLSIFVHFSFFAPVLILIFYILLGNKQYLYFIFLVLSFFISEIDIDFFRSIFNKLPDIFKVKAEGYMTVDSYQNQLAIAERTNWYIRNYMSILKYLSTTFIIVIFINKDYYYNCNKIIRNLWCYTSLFYAFSNVLYLLPQGVRFYGIANILVFMMLGIASSLSDLPILFRKLGFLSIPFLLLIIIVDLRKGMDFTGLSTILGNPFISHLFKGDIPIIQLIK